MKIRMLTGISGLDFNLVPKEETERFGDGEAVRLMVSDQAEPADEESAAALAEAHERDVADYEGKRLIEAGQAVRVETDEERDARLAAEGNAATAVADARAEELKQAEEEAAAKAAAEAVAAAAAEAEAKAKAEAEAAAAAAAEPTYPDLATARKAHKEIVGKGTSPSWTIEQIVEKIVAHKAQA